MSSRSDNERLLSDYGAAFVTAWKITHNYRVWFSNKHAAMVAVAPGYVRFTSVSGSKFQVLLCVCETFGIYHLSWGHLCLLCCRHPFQGQYSVADVKLRFSQ